MGTTDATNTTKSSTGLDDAIDIIQNSTNATNTTKKPYQPKVDPDFRKGEKERARQIQRNMERFIKDTEKDIRTREEIESESHWLYTQTIKKQSEEFFDKV